MTDPDLIGLFIEPFEKLAVPYMVTGGVASVIYGDPRFTRDVDVVLELERSKIGPLISSFSTGEFYVPPVEAVEREVARSRGGHFNIIHPETALRADVYLTGDDPLHAWAFERRERVPVEELEIWVAPIEYVVLRKLEYFRTSGSDRHLRDVAMMLRISGDAIDRAALERWLEKLDLRGPMEEAAGYEP